MTSWGQKKKNKAGSENTEDILCLKIEKGFSSGFRALLVMVCVYAIVSWPKASPVTKS